MRLIRKYQNKSVRFTIVLVLGAVLLLGLKFSIDKSNIRNSVLQAIQSGVAPEALIVFIFTEEESQNLNWKKSHEFEFEGEMYDIVETKIEEGAYHYTCFHDTKETKFKRRTFKLLGSLLLPENDSQSDQNTNLKLVKTQFFQTLKTVLLLPVLGDCKQIDFCFQNSYRSLMVGPNSPPPQL